MSSNSSNSDIESASSLPTKSRDGKIARLIPVIFYIFLVSGLGVMLSVYHFFVWDSRKPPVAKIPGHEIY